MILASRFAWMVFHYLGSLSVAGPWVLSDILSLHACMILTGILLFIRVQPSMAVILWNQEMATYTRFHVGLHSPDTSTGLHFRSLPPHQFVEFGRIKTNLNPSRADSALKPDIEVHQSGRECIYRYTCDDGHHGLQNAWKKVGQTIERKIPRFGIK